MGLSPLRLLAMAVLSVVASLALLLLITHRNLERLGAGQVELNYALLRAQGAPAAGWVQRLWPGGAPLWAKRLVLAWQRMDLWRWWWLPVVVFVAQALVVRHSRRRLAARPPGRSP